MKLGANVLWNVYWQTQSYFVDLLAQAEPLFVLPNNNWNAARPARMNGRKLLETEMPVRSCVFSDNRWLSQAHNVLGLVYRGAGQLSLLEYDRLTELTFISKDGLPAKVIFFSKKSNTTTTTLVVTQNTDLEILGLVPLQYAQQWYTGSILHPEVEAALSAFRSAPRYMDWCGCGIAGTKQWREPTEEYTWSNFEYLNGRDGSDRFGPLPYIGKILAKHPRKSWVCIPPSLTEDDIRLMARRIKADAPNAELEIEFGNELWNWAFAVTNTFQAGRPQGMDPAEWYVRRAKRAIEIFEEEFGRVTRIVAWQAAVSWSFGRNPWAQNQPVNEYIHQNLAWFDKIAIAPYFLGAFANNQTVSEADFQTSMSQVIEWCNQWSTIAQEHNKQLVCYEGGMHLSSPGMHESLRNSPQMANWYTEYLNRISPYFTDCCLYALAGPTWGLVRGGGDPSPTRLSAVFTFPQS